MMTTVSLTSKTIHSWQGTAKIDKAKYGDGFAVITAALTKLGDQPPSFSVQGETWTTEFAWRNNRTESMHSAGAQHELALELFPFLAPIVALHLSDVAGVPMHADANGWYWYSDNDGKGVHELYSSPYASMTPHERELLPLDMDRDAFYAYTASLRPQWLLEASRALDLIMDSPPIDLTVITFVGKPVTFGGTAIRQADSAPEEPSV
jgi:hypothetical protein